MAIHLRNVSQVETSPGYHVASTRDEKTRIQNLGFLLYKRRLSKNFQPSFFRQKARDYCILPFPAIRSHFLGSCIPFPLRDMTLNSNPNPKRTAVFISQSQSAISQIHLSYRVDIPIIGTFLCCLTILHRLSSLISSLLSFISFSARSCDSVIVKNCY